MAGLLLASFSLLVYALSAAVLPLANGAASGPRRVRSVRDAAPTLS